MIVTWAERHQCGHPVGRRDVERSGTAGGSFGPATTFPAASLSGLGITPGHAMLVLNGDTISTEPAS